MKMLADSVSGKDGAQILGPASSLGRQDKVAFWGLLYKGTQPIHEGFVLLGQSLPKPPHSNIMLVIRIQHVDFGRICIFRSEHPLMF